MSLIYVLIFTAIIPGGGGNVAVTHTETVYPTLQACRQAYSIDQEQMDGQDAHLRGTCLAVPKQ